MYKLITLLVLFFVPTFFQWEILEVLKLKTFDALVTKQEASGNFTILNITEKDVDKEGGYPFPRHTLIGEETAKYSCYPLKELKPIEVKGKAKPLKVYTWE